MIRWDHVFNFGPRSSRKKLARLILPDHVLYYIKNPTCINNLFRFWWVHEPGFGWCLRSPPEEENREGTFFSFDSWLAIKLYLSSDFGKDNAEGRQHHTDPSEGRLIREKPSYFVLVFKLLILWCPHESHQLFYLFQNFSRNWRRLSSGRILAIEQIFRKTLVLKITGDLEVEHE